MKNWDDFDKEFLAGSTSQPSKWDDLDKAFFQKPINTSKQFSKKDAIDKTASEMGGASRFLAGIGAAVDNNIRGVRQAFTTDPKRKQALEEEEREARQLQSGLGGWGTAGKVAGSVAQMIPAAFIPGANTVAGAGVVGALAGAAEPTVEGESRVRNAALGGALGGGSQWGLGKIGNAATERIMNLKALKASKANDTALVSKLMQEGYKVPRSELGGGAINNLLESMAGKASLKQGMILSNQSVTDRLARQAVGAPDTMPLTLRSLRENVTNTGPYQRLDSIKQLNFTPEYSQSLKRLADQFGGQNSRLTTLRNPDVIKMAQELDFATASGKEVNQLIKNLREVGNTNKSAAYGSAPAQKELGKAQIEATKALEKLVDDNVGINPSLQGVIPELQSARKRIAKLHTVENASNPVTGEVSAKYLGRQMQKGKPIEGDLKTIAEFDQRFPKFSGLGASTPAPDVSALNTTAMPLMGAAGAVASGSPVGAIMGGMPLMRSPIRKMLSSDWYQRGNMPSYKTSLFDSMPYNHPASLFLGRSLAPSIGLEYTNE